MRIFRINFYSPIAFSLKGNRLTKFKGGACSAPLKIPVANSHWEKHIKCHAK